jgi:hypothetical protein
MLFDIGEATHTLFLRKTKMVHTKTEKVII